MFALIKNDTVAQYPYSITDLRFAHPNTSFPSLPDDETLEAFGLYRVVASEQPQITSAEVLVQETPVFDQSTQQWRQVWSVRNKTPNELQAEADARAQDVRADRNKRLADSDWTQVADAPVDKATWAAYRQALRDISSQQGFPWTITWPEMP